MNHGLMEFLSETLRKAGLFIKEKKVVGDYKLISDSADRFSSLHTEYDQYANDYLLELMIPKLFPFLNVTEILVISEESENPYIVYANMHVRAVDEREVAEYSGCVLVIDPICGSIPYVRGIADYVISVGIINNLTCIASCIYQPDLDELFYAEKGYGAYLNGEKICPISTIDNLENAYLSIEHGVYRAAPEEDVKKIAQKVMRIRTAGTCALEMCYVACGRLDGLIKLNQAFYDYIPGALILAESGLGDAFVALDGKTPILPLKSLNQKVSFLATNGIITSELASYTANWYIAN